MAEIAPAVWKDSPYHLWQVSSLKGSQWNYNTSS
jgi:hypothetical protein